MDEMTEKIEVGSWHETMNVRTPMLTNDKYVDRIIKNLRQRNITHSILHSVGGYKHQVCLRVGYAEIYFWVVDEEQWQRASA